ncbi:DNA-binding transcriptional regulator, MarR family [Bacillus sp. OV194]|nr:DNA-binding transcriptional regulator, MarR family [Bacillus sp. OV194]
MQSQHKDVSVGFLINQTSRKTINLLMHRFREFDITPEQWSVLYQLFEDGGITQKELARRTAKDQPTTARILDILMKKELIQKQMSETDRRAFIVSLTEKGEEIASKTVPIEAETMKEILAGIEPAEVERLKEVLEKLSKNIDDIINS